MLWESEVEVILRQKAYFTVTLGGVRNPDAVSIW